MPPRPTPPSADRRLPITLMVAAAGATSLLLLYGVYRLGLRADADADLGRTAHIRAELALSRLALEPCEHADETRTREHYQRLGRALALGGELEQDPWVRRHAAALVEQLGSFRDLAITLQLACERTGAVEPGLDTSYRTTFAALLRSIDGLEAALEERAELERARTGLAVGGLGAAWGLLIALATYALFRRQRQRREMAAALAASREQLLRAQKIDAVGRLAGGIAHDVNNYLAAIYGHCEVMLLHRPADEAMARKLEAIGRIVRKASVLIDQLLSFGRRQPAEPQVVRLNEIVSGLERMLHRLVGEDVRLELRLAPDLHAVKIDPSRLEQVLVNLVVNARDAIRAAGEQRERRGGTIVLETTNLRALSLSTESLLQPEAFVVLSVADDGIGMSQEVRERIFEPFFTTKEGSGHGGLGLAIVFTIVQEAGGHVEVVSEPDRGAVFKVYLPQSREAPLAVASSTESLYVPGGSESILVVDDADDVRAATRALLDALGYQVTTAASGEEAVELVEQGALEIDLLLSDLVLPDMSGGELIARLGRRRRLASILVSGHTQSVVGRHGLPPENVPLLRKPFSARELAMAVRSALGDAGAC